MQSAVRIVIAALLTTASLGARAQQAPDVQRAPAYWRNYRRTHAAYSADSEPCVANARTAAVGMNAAAQATMFQGCMVEHGWMPMRVLPDPPSCAAVALQPAGADSTSNAAFFAELTAALERLYRPLAPDDSAAAIVMQVENADINTHSLGIYDVRMPHAVRVAVAVARRELPDFANHMPPGKTVEVVARFEPKCVSEFPVVVAEKPPEPAYFEFQVEKVVRPRNVVRPKYPPSLESGGVDGRVLVQFVVDTLGKVDLRTFKVLESSHALFTAAVHEALPGMRFEPATIRGLKVRQVVQQPFNFSVRP